MNPNVILAVFKRNFVSYFTNPTGYVFICVFVALSSIAAFWPDDFFNSRLASLEQLNFWFPYIMLIFIPAITMSTWAEEREQGTDELLLTIPSRDIDVVLGKYFASSSIFTVSILFSFVTSLLMLKGMGQPDMGLIVCNYLGYWFVGLAMISIGMVASFLTKNLTVAFVLGALFNAPLVFMANADLIFSSTSWGVLFKNWSINQLSIDFNRGVFNFSPVICFLLIVVMMLYLCTLLLGRRHWLGGRDGQSLLGHYLLRFVAMSVACVAVMVFVCKHEYVRLDLTSSQVNSLSEDSISLIRNLNEKDIEKVTKEIQKAEKRIKKLTDAKSHKDVIKREKRELKTKQLELKRLNNTVQIEAFISNDVPESYLRLRLELITKLNELVEESHQKISLKIIPIDDTNSDEADRAEDLYDITSRSVLGKSRGVDAPMEIFLGAAFISGGRTEIISFFERGVSLEYQLVRSILSVAQTKQFRIGVVAPRLDLFTAVGRRQAGRDEDQRLINELRKYMDVVEVNERFPISWRKNNEFSGFDVLLVAQPSTLTPVQFGHVENAIRSGLPTLILEDPLPGFYRGVPGTGQRPQQFSPNSSGDSNGELIKLWEMLEIEMVNSYFKNTSDEDESEADPKKEADQKYEEKLAILWQKYRPYPRLRKSRMLENEFLFIRETGINNAFSDDEVTNGLHEVFFAYAGAFQKRASIKKPSLTFTPLVLTSDDAGVISYDEFEKLRADRSSTSASQNYLKQMSIEHRLRDKAGKEITEKQFCVAARISGVPKQSTLGALNQQKIRKSNKVNVIVVADIDWIVPGILGLPEQVDSEYKFRMQNLAFILNAIDSLAGDDRFIEIRKRRVAFGELTKITQQEDSINKDVERAIEEANKQYLKADEDATKKIKEAAKELENKINNRQNKEVDINSIRVEILALRERANNLKQQQVGITQRAKKKLDKEIKDQEKHRDRKIADLENRFKFLAVCIPPIPPLVIAIFVFFYRRAREGDGAISSRLR